MYCKILYGMVLHNKSNKICITRYLLLKTKVAICPSVKKKVLLFFPQLKFPCTSPQTVLFPTNQEIKYAEDFVINYILHIQFNWIVVLKFVLPLRTTSQFNIVFY